MRNFLVALFGIIQFRSTYAIGFASCQALANSTPNDAVMYLGDCYQFNRTNQLHVTLRDVTCPKLGGFLATIMSTALHTLLNSRYTGQAHIGMEQEWNQTGTMDKWYWLGPDGRKYPIDWNVTVPPNVITDGGGAGDETNGENYGAMVTAGINDVGNHNLLGICQFVGPNRSYLRYRSGARITYPIQFTMSNVPTLAVCIRKCNRHLTCMSLSYSSQQQLCLEHQLLPTEPRVTINSTDSSFEIYSRVEI